MINIFKESLEHGDLKRLVHDELHIDEFKSKLGDDQDVCVVSFKVAGKEPANDIVSFVEKGYEWVIDADVSSGEMSDGDYIVFIEIPRDNEIVSRIIDLMDDLMNLTEQDTSSWRVRYYTDTQEHAFSEETLDKLIPKSSSEYNKRFGHQELDKLKTAAGVEVTTKAPKNEFTENLRIAAGIL